MEPGIERSISQGFRAANRSWAGIGLFIGAWLLVTMIAVILLALTRPPQELFQSRAEAPTGGVPVTSPTLPATSPSAQKVNVFQQLASTATTAAPADGATKPVVRPEAAEALKRQRAAEQDRIVADWFKRAWPAVLFCMAMFIVGNVWLSGGQIGYLAKHVATQQATLSDFASAGTSSFGTLLGASLVLLLALGGFSLIVALVVVFLSALSRVMPGWLIGILGVLLALGTVIGLIWLFVRAAFWFIAIVVEHVGVVHGFNASFRASRGRWWPVAGLGLLMVAIGYGVWVPFGLLEWVGNLMGGGTALVLGLVSNVFGLLASLYVGFATLAAYLCFYEDAKTVSAQPTTSPVPQ